MDSNQTKNLLYSQNIKMAYNELRVSEKKVADYVLKNPQEILEISMLELASKAGTSEPSIMRFIRSIGYSGYNDLKLHIARDLGKMNRHDHSPLKEVKIDKNDKIESLPAKIVSITSSGLQQMLEILDPQELKRAIGLIRTARIVDVYGVGNSAVIAEDITHKLMRIGICSRTFSDPHMQIMSACNLCEKDVVIAISHSGKTKDIIDSVKTASESGAKIIVITNYLAVEIMKFADVKLLTSSYETSFFSETMVSRIMQLSIVDMIYTGLLLSDYDSSVEKIDRFHEASSNKQI